MVKTVCCTRGHYWQIPDDALLRTTLREIPCPTCGEQAETIVDSIFRETRNDPQQPASSPNDPHRLTGYEILEEAGRGGMGVVYRAFDIQHNRIVALKTLQRIDATALHRFKKEFRALSDIAHQNLVSLYELISDGENWCFTMELIDGVDLLQYIRYGPAGAIDTPVGDATIELDAAAVRYAGKPGLSPVQLARLRSVVGQLAAGIAALHAAGILHRDIKPSNVMVTKEGRAVLLDFGLAAELDNSEMHRNSQDSILGTVLYMSPEQAASDLVSHATDWYSLGSLLYEALSGRPPFSGKTLQILQLKQNEDPPPPSAIWPDVPRDLEQLCVRLLHRDPTQRATGSEVLRVLGQADRVIDSQRSSKDEANHLIGREEQLVALQASYADVRDGNASSVLVRGASGNGKSTLVQHFLDGIRNRDDAIVLSGRCYERESVPFKAIDSLIDSVVAHLKQLSPAEVEALMPRDMQSLIRLFPVIGQIGVGANLPRRKSEISDQQELNRRAIGALRELLARMGDRCRLVVYIDDLQWGDADSAAMLSDLLQRPDAPVLLFLGTYRSEDAETSPFLYAFRQIQQQRELPLEILEIEVKPLDLADAARLAIALLKRDDADAQRSAEAIAQDAAGNPFLVSELVKQVQLDGGLVSNSNSEPLVLADMIWARVRRLPDESQRLLELVTLWGQPLSLDKAMQIADVGQSAVGPLRAGNLVRTIGSSSSSIIETYHDRVRESVSARLDQPTRRQHHLRIAEDCARQSSLSSEQLVARLDEAPTSTPIDSQLDVVPVWYDVAFHFDAAGRPDLAFPYALVTAEKARTQFSLEVSEQQYRIAERGLEGYDEAIRFRVAEGLGDVLMLGGKYEQAAETFEVARKLGTETNEHARLEGKIGELAFKRGNNQTAAEALERSLRLLGRKIPPFAAAFMLFLGWEVWVQTLHSVFPRLFLARRKTQDADHELLVIRLYTTLAYAYFFERGKIPCLWAHLRAINLAERFPPTRELGHAWATHAPVLALIPWIARGAAYGRKSFEVRKELGDLWGQGQALSYWGIVLSVGSRFDESISKCSDAVKVFERTGDFWELHIARWFIALNTYRKGGLARAVAHSQRLFETASQMGDDKVSAFSLDVWSRASGGHLPADIAQRELQKERQDVQATAQVLLAEAVRLLAQNELAEAVTVLTRAQEVCGEVGMKNDWVSPVWPWRATALRLQCENPTDGPHDRQLMIRNAAHAARQALGLARKFNNDLPHALRECGLIAEMQGRLRKARKCLDESLAVAERQGARFETAQSLFARGQVGQRHGWPEASQDLRTAKQSLVELGADFILQQRTFGEEQEGD